MILRFEQFFVLDCQIPFLHLRLPCVAHYLHYVVFYKLLRNRTRALAPVCRQVNDDNTRKPAHIDPVMPIKTLVLYSYERVFQMLRHFVKCGVFTVLLAA